MTDLKPSLHKIPLSDLTCLPRGNILKAEPPIMLFTQEARAQNQVVYRYEEITPKPCLPRPAWPRVFPCLIYVHNSFFHPQSEGGSHPIFAKRVFWAMPQLQLAAPPGPPSNIHSAPVSSDGTEQPCLSLGEKCTHINYTLLLISREACTYSSWPKVRSLSI